MLTFCMAAFPQPETRTFSRHATSLGWSAIRTGLIETTSTLASGQAEPANESFADRAALANMAS
jgi:hypothetical protein